jgi:hypothetical protein
VGLTLLWDAFEFVRQSRRVMKGHAPANPDNPRHAGYLQKHDTATTRDWLNRDPHGRPLSPADLEIKGERAA